MDWYNMEDRTNYDFACYMIELETYEDSFFHLLNDDKNEANDFMIECKNNIKYMSVSKVYKINKKTYNLIMGINEDDEANDFRRHIIGMCDCCNCMKIQEELEAKYGKW